MSKINKLKSQLKKLPKYLAKKFGDKLVEIIIASIFGLVTLSWLFEPLGDFLLAILQLPITKLPEELLLYHLLLLTLILSLLIYLFIIIRKEIKKKENPYYFIESEVFKWRVTKITGTVKREPFCPQHEYELKEYRKGVVGMRGSTNSYYCEICGKYLVENVPDYAVTNAYDVIKRKAEARFNGYGKGF